MPKYPTLPGRDRNSTIPQAIVPVNDIYLPLLKKEAADTFRRMGTDQADVKIDDPLVVTGIIRSLKGYPKNGDRHQLTMDIEGKTEQVEIEKRGVNGFRITRVKKTPPAIPPVKKR